MSAQYGMFLNSITKECKGDYQLKTRHAIYDSLSDLQNSCVETEECPAATTG